VRTYDIHKPVLDQAYGPDSQSGQDVRDSLRKLRNLLVEIDLVTPGSKKLWRRFNLWDEAA
jgi:hypothetical protein